LFKSFKYYSPSNKSIQQSTEKVSIIFKRQSVTVTSISEVIVRGFERWEEVMETMVRVSCNSVEQIGFKFNDKLGEGWFGRRVVLKPTSFP